MRQLSDTIARLAAFRSIQQKARFTPANDRLVELRDFGPNPGALVARMHVPETLRPGAALVVVLHGCTQTPGGYDHGAGWTRMADQLGFAVLFPEQQRANNPNLCFNWFLPDDSRRNAGEALSIRNMIAAALSRHALAADRVFINGLSAGGAMTSTMLATYPEVFAAGAIIAGLPYGVASSVPEAFDRMRGHGLPPATELQRRVCAATDHAGPWPAVSIWHGTADQVVAPANGEAIAMQWCAIHRLPATPASTQKGENHTRRIWTDASGKVLVDHYRIDGMGHGTPIDARDGAGTGRAGPFMLDVGVSSTRILCANWELDTPSDLAAPEFQSVAPGPEQRIDTRPQVMGANDDASARASDARKSASGVGQIIERALRAAGLM